MLHGKLIIILFFIFLVYKETVVLGGRRVIHKNLVLSNELIKGEFSQ